MKVLLLKDVSGHGKEGDVVDISDGYARNYLIPRKLAVAATQGMEKEMNVRKAAEARRRAVDKEAAEKIAQRMEGMKLTLPGKAGENGRLFGSISGREIAEALNTEHHIEVDRKKIELESAIHELGTYNVRVRLFANVSANIQIEVVAGE